MAENVESLEGIKAKVEQFSQDVKLSAPEDAVVVRNESSTGIDRENIAIANSFIVKNAREFRCIRVNEDPRTTNNIKWLSIEEVERIHINIIHQIGGKSGIHNRQDLEYCLNRPLIVIDGCEPPTLIERICNCAYSIGNCFVDAGAQTAATIFLTLCKLNDINVEFKCGEIYDIFPKVISRQMMYSEFILHMFDRVKHDMKEY